MGAIAAGYDGGDCATIDTTGGITLIKIGNRLDVDTITRDADGDISTVVFKASKAWFDLKGFEVNATNLSETQNGDSAWWTQNLQVTILGRNKTLKKFIVDCVNTNNCGLILAGKEANGNKFAMGFSPVDNKSPAKARCLNNAGNTNNGGENNEKSTEVLNFQCVDIGKAPHAAFIT
jgi:hypothetical protein